ncbi:hypothetical protein ACJX0J_031951, partial [Zea mays]
QALGTGVRESSGTDFGVYSSPIHPRRMNLNLFVRGTSIDSENLLDIRKCLLLLTQLKF